MKYKLIIPLSLVSIILIIVLESYSMKNRQFNSMSYKIIKPTEANKLISDENNTFISTISFNEASIYQLKNKELLVAPIIPFFNSLIISDSIFLEECIKKEEFPMVDTANGSLFDKVELSRFTQLQSELQKMIGFNPDSSVNLNDVDQKMKSLLKENTFKDYRKSFIVLLGNLIISKNKENLGWAFIRDIGTLNPPIKLVVCNNQNNSYYPIEECVMKFEKDYKSFKDEASLNMNLKIMLDFPKKIKEKYFTKIK